MAKPPARVGSFMLATEATGFLVSDPIADMIFIRLEQAPFGMPLRAGLVAEMTVETAIEFATRLIAAAQKAAIQRERMGKDERRTP